MRHRSIFNENVYVTILSHDLRMAFWKSWSILNLQKNKLIKIAKITKCNCDSKQVFLFWHWKLLTDIRSSESALNSFSNPWMHLKYLRKAVTEMIKTRSVPTLPPLWVMKMQKSIIEQTKSLSCLTYEYGFKERRNSFRVYYLCLYTYMISSCASKSHLNKNMSVQLLQMLRYEKMDMYVKAT